MAYPSRPGYRILFGTPLTPGVKKLLIATAAVFGFQLLERLTGSDQLTALLGFRPVSVWQDFQLWRPVTYLFLHGDFFHILVNLLFLYFFGPDLERLWGTARFYRYYFTTGVGPALVALLLNPASAGITIGCSGAIYGILLAYGLHFPDRIVYIYLIFPVKVKYLVLALSLLAFFASIGGGSAGIAHWAHLGGLIVGLIYLRGRLALGLCHTAYLRWKLERSKSRFQVYYRETRRNSEDEERPPTIH